MRNGHCYLHSQMLAVRQQYRNGGLGRRMKLYQREDALARGFELMEWTFDPLEIKNAYLNIEKLGAIARRYNVNQYGITSSPLQGGLPTDRLVAEWWMKSKRVEAVLAEAPRAKFECRARIDVPAEIYAWKAEAATRPQALAVQTSNRERFNRAFAEGLSVLGYERDGHGNGRFLLGNWDEALAVLACCCTDAVSESPAASQGDGQAPSVTDIRLLLLVCPSILAGPKFCVPAPE